MTRNVPFTERLVPILIFCMATFSSLAGNYDFDKKIGMDGAKMVELTYGIYNDVAKTAYVKRIGQRLTAALKSPPFDFHFQIADSWTPNAFALPGGHVYVTRGILALANSEAELACVMAHEIIHASERHGVKQLGASILPRLLEVPGKIVGNVIDNDLGALINAPIKTSNDLFLARYGWRHEKEADELGVRLAANAGYDPRSLSTILGNLSRAIEMITGEKEKRSYFNDHPITSRRLKYLGKTVNRFNWQSKSDLAPKFLEMLEGLPIKQNPAKGIFQGQLFLHPDLDLFIRFPKDWKTLNTPVMVGAHEPSGKAGIFLGPADSSKTPEQQGQEFHDQVDRKFGSPITRSEPVEINDFPGYIVTLTDRSGFKPSSVHMLWFQMKSHVHRVIGFGLEEYFPLLKEAARSVRHLTQAEKQSIKIDIIDIVMAKEEESLEQLCQRTKNKWKPDITALVNGLPESVRLQNGQKLKILKEVSYSQMVDF